MRHFHHLEKGAGERFGAALILRGVRERFMPIAASAVALIAFFLPFVVMGNTAGLEIVHPMAVAALGGILTSTLITLAVVPALYAKFGLGAAAAADLDLSPAGV